MVNSALLDCSIPQKAIRNIQRPMFGFTVTRKGNVSLSLQPCGIFEDLLIYKHAFNSFY